MKIIMKTLSQDANGMRIPGRQYDVPAEEAAELIKGGYAFAIEQLMPETAAFGQADETAVIAPARPRRRRKS